LLKLNGFIGVYCLCLTPARHRERSGEAGGHGMMECWNVDFKDVSHL